MPKNEKTPPAAGATVADPPDAAQSVADAAAQSAAPPAAAAPEPPKKKNADQQFYAFPIPSAFESRDGVSLLMEACTLYNINPDPSLVPGDRNAPRQLLEWKYYPNNADRFDLPEKRVVLVTAAGLKLSYPADADTVERLQRVFRLVRKKKGPNNEEITDILPMPEDVSLPSSAITGLVESGDHQYKDGYLRTGGRSEGARRQQLRQKAGLA